MAKGNLAAGTADFLQWAKKGQGFLANLQMRVNEPSKNRQMRDFRMKEVLELTGLKHHAWRSWIAENIPGPAGEVRLSLEQVHQFMSDHNKRPSRPDGAAPMRLGVATLKGGAAKTITCLHLAHAFAIRGYRVLLIDGDPQGTLTTLCGIRAETVEPDNTLAAVFDRVDSPDLFDEPALRPQKTHIDGLDFVPATLQMINSDFVIGAAFMDLHNRAAAQRFYTVLDDELKRIESDYDIILFDTSPSFSYVGISLMWAAHGLIIPMQPSLPDYRATLDFAQMFGQNIGSIERAARVTRKWNPVAVVHTRVDNSPKAEQTTELVRSFSVNTFFEHRLDVHIPHSQAVISSTSQFRSVYEMKGGEVRKVRDAFDALATRVLTSVNEVWSSQVSAETAEAP
jgi:chromosome partitioning protein